MLHNRRNTGGTWMPMSRVPILLLFTVCAMSAIGHAQSAARTSRPISLDLSRINTLNRNVVAADFNGDGIIDLAASEISAPIGISSTGFISPAAPNVAMTAPSSPTLPPGNVSSASGGPVVSTGVSAPAGNATVSNSAAVPSAGVPTSAATPVAPAAAPAPAVAVFGTSVSVPNSAVAQPFATAVGTVPSTSFA